MQPPLIKHYLIPLYLGLCIAMGPSTVFSQNQAVILQYHHVSTQMPAITSLSPDAFSEHMNYLENNEFTVLRLEDVISSLKSGQPIPDKTAVITFDDGYTSVYDVAFPVLMALEWPYTVFVTTGLVGSNDSLYATWDQLREMAGHGATLANHTVTHPYLLDRSLNQTESDWLAQVRQEIVEAENTLVEQTGQNHKLLAYPYGEYNSEIQELVELLGFTGIGQHSGPISTISDFTALPRFPFSGIYASMNTFPTKVRSLAFDLVDMMPLSPATSSTSPEASLIFASGQTGLAQFTCFNNNERIRSELQANDERRYLVTSHVNNQSRRFRYNCTAPGENDRYYWVSIPWVNPEIRE
ncbi:MAG: polysaccharide deacetylase family protein [Gammaproteobacteria bacterium]|nr:polysaccharide deacetylase family protein [Gammaproteobacteria bacterium]